MDKHPAPEKEINFDDTNLPTLDSVTESETKIAVFNFDNGSGAGIDGLRSQHLKDMLSAELGENGKLLLTRLSTFSDQWKCSTIHHSDLVWRLPLCVQQKRQFNLAHRDWQHVS